MTGVRVVLDIAVCLVLAAALSVASSAVALGPPPSPIPTPSPSLSPVIEVRWQLADGLLGNSIPGLSVDTTPPVAWAGRFWAIETGAVASPNGDGQGRVTWHDPAIWWSGDGKLWTRRALPSGMTGQLSLVPWGAGLAIYDWRDAPEPAGLQFLVWSSTDGLRWQRHGGLDLRPTGDLRGCGFLNAYLESAGDRLVVSANCAVLHGAGGEVVPGFGTVASAASANAGEIPTYTWTSDDGHRWARHRVPVTKDGRGGVVWFVMFRSVGGGIAAVTAGPHARLLWSTDGATFRTVAALPGQRDDSVEAIDATTGSDGAPISWLLVLVHPPDSSAATRTLWRLDPGGRWKAVLAPALVRVVDIVTGGMRVLLVGTLAWAGSDDTVRLETFLSPDGASTWTSSIDPVPVSDCDPRLSRARRHGGDGLPRQLRLKTAACERLGAMKAAIRLVPILAVLATALGIGAVTTMAPATPALADCGIQAPPGSISGYRGLAFIGIVARTEQVDAGANGELIAITYEVERMLAGQPVASMTVVEGDGGSCWYVDGRRLRIGDRVLISAAAVLDIGAGHPFLSHELIWRSTGPETWRFASGMYGIYLDAYPLAARAATTTRAIQALVGPPFDLPDTSTSAVPGTSSPRAGPGSAATRLTTCGGHAYPGLGVEAPVAYGSIDEIQALEPALIRYADAFPGSSSWPWRLAGRDETGMLFLAPTDAYGPPGWMSVEVTTAGNGPGDASMGQCDPRVVPSADLGAADWWLDTHEPPPDATSTELHLLVLERACASGSSAEGRIADPAIDYGTTSVTITIGVRRAIGDQGCPGNPPTPFVVLLNEPLGARTLLDGGHAPPVPPSPPEP